MKRPTKKEREIVKRMDSIRALLKKFGLGLRAYDPGVIAVDAQYRRLDFGQIEWEWLEPILKRAAPPPAPAGKPTLVGKLLEKE